MEAFYVVLFAALAALAALLETGRGRAGGGALTHDFVAFRNNYVLVYALMMGEWWRVVGRWDDAPTAARASRFNRRWSMSGEREKNGTLPPPCPLSPPSVLELGGNTLRRARQVVAAQHAGSRGRRRCFRGGWRLFFQFNTMPHSQPTLSTPAGDWLQGPYVYALYQHYGFDRGAIGKLFIAGFGSSMFFGTIVGSLADKTGRKKAALTYIAAYAAGCATKHSPAFAVLLVGRLLCGVATSLLYSAFESWLVAEHSRRGYDADLLGGTFARAVFVGNGLVAIVAGLAAHFLVETLALGPVAPFDAAATVLLAGGVVVAMTWTENFGDATDRRPLTARLASAARAIGADPKIALLGAEQALFEAAMYTFVFLWTPALAPRGERVPHGFVFALFMVSSMAGSALAGRLLAAAPSGAGPKPEKYMQAVFAAGAAALAVPALVHALSPAVAPTDATSRSGSPIGAGGRIQLVAFCAFEACVGVFWPSVMAMRARYLPEDARATIINFFRIPLNFFVCAILYNVSAYPLWGMFAMCSAFLAGAAALQAKLEAVATRDAAAATVKGGGVPPGVKVALASPSRRV